MSGADGWTADGDRCGVEYEPHPTRPTLVAVCTKPTGHDGPHDNVLAKPGVTP